MVSPTRLLLVGVGVVTLAALSYLLLAGVLPERFHVQDYPTARCASALQEFDTTCAGLSVAKGETFSLDIVGIETLWQNLRVSATVYNREHAQHGITANLRMRQNVFVREAGGEWRAVSKQDPRARLGAPAGPVVDWLLACPEGAETCDEAFVLQRSGLPYPQMRLELTLVPDDADPTDGEGRHYEAFMGEVVFHVRHETVAFTYFEFGLRYAFVAISLLSLLRFRSAFKLHLGGVVPWGDRDATQKAVYLLLVANLLNNNPLFALWAWRGKWYLQLAEQLEQSLLVHALMLWLLVVFDALGSASRPGGAAVLAPDRAAPPPPDRRMGLGKLLLVGTLWLLDAVRLCLLQLALRADPSAVLADLPGYPVLWVYAPAALRAVVALQALLLVFRALLHATANLAQPCARRGLPLLAVASLSVATLLVAKPFELAADDFSAEWLALSMGVLNAYVALMALGFEASKAALAHLDRTAQERARAEALLLQAGPRSDQPAEHEPGKPEHGRDRPSAPAPNQPPAAPQPAAAAEAKAGEEAGEEAGERASTLARRGAAVLSTSDATMSVRLEHLSPRALGQLAVAGLLLAALGLGFASGRLPERFDTRDIPTAQCVSPLDAYSPAGCAGIGFARGEPFALELRDVATEWQNLRVGATVYNREHAQHGIAANLRMRQNVFVREAGGEWRAVSKQDPRARLGAPAGPVVDWPLACPESAETCDEAFVLQRSGLPYPQMRLELTLVPDDADPTDGEGRHYEAFMGEVVFHVRHETVAFTYFEFGLRYALVGVALLGLCQYLAAFWLRRRGLIPFSEWQPAQQALLLLMVANLLNNNPLFALWAWRGKWYLQLAEQLEQSLLVHALMLWLLVVFDGMTLVHVLRADERKRWWLGKLLLVGTLWLLDSAEKTLLQYHLRLDPSAVISDLPLYPYLWVHAPRALRVTIGLLTLTVFFRTFLTLTDRASSKASSIKFSSFMTTAAVTLVASPSSLRRDDVSALWVLVSLGVMNAYVLLMGVAFEPSAGARAAFALSQRKREHAVALIHQVASQADPSQAALYSPELLVKTVGRLEPGQERTRTLEQHAMIGRALRRNPATYRSLDEEGGGDEATPEHDDMLASGHDVLTPKLEPAEDLRPGHLITLVDGRATRHPDDVLASVGDLWLGEWFVAGPPPARASVEQLLLKEDGTTAPQHLLSCVSEGVATLEVRVDGPVRHEARVVAKVDRATGERAVLFAAVDTASNDSMLAQTIGYVEKALTLAQFEAAVRQQGEAAPEEEEEPARRAASGAPPRAPHAVVQLTVRVVGKYHDPFAEEEQLRFPFVLVLKEVTDEKLLAAASTAQVGALTQAAHRAVAMAQDAAPPPAGAGAAPADAYASFDEELCAAELSAARAAQEREAELDGQASLEAALEAELECGAWRDEAPRSTEEAEVLALLRAHFELRLFHVARPDGRKAVLLLRMRDGVLRRELRAFLLERWEGEGKRAVSSEAGARFTDVADMLAAVESGALAATPAERLELYDRLLRKLFHAKSLGFAELPSGTLHGAALPAELEVEKERQFVPISFCAWERPKPLEEMAAAELRQLLPPAAAEHASADGRMSHAELVALVRATTAYERSVAATPEAALRRAAAERGATFELVQTAFPRHLPELSDWLSARLNRNWDLTPRDLTVVRNHYGEEMALYLAFMNKYNNQLMPFALVGLLVWLACRMRPGDFAVVYAPLAPLFCVAMVIFSALLQLQWRHENQRLAYRWGVTDYEPSDYVRPEFRGEPTWDFVKQRMVYQYPAWKRWVTIKPLSLLVIFLMTLLLMILSFALYVQLQDSLENPVYSELVRTLLGAGLNGILYGVLIMVCMMMFFMEVAKELGKLENYRTEKEFNDQYVLKMFFFIFVDGYMMFWIIGLYHIPLAMYSSFAELSHVSVAGVRLFYKEGQLDVYLEQLTTICVTAIITVQLLTLVLENVLPFVIKHFVERARKPKRAALSPRARFLQALVDEAERDDFDLFGDYYDAVLFLGYGVVYSALWPLAPLVNWANNMIEARADVTKFMQIFRRPVPHKVNTIGMWEQCMWFQTFTSVVQISLIMAFGTRLLDYYAEWLGFSAQRAPSAWVGHGAEPHLAPSIKLVVCGAASLCGFALILLVRTVVGPDDPRTRLRLARDDFLERKEKVRKFGYVG